MEKAPGRLMLRAGLLAVAPSVVPEMDTDTASCAGQGAVAEKGIKAAAVQRSFSGCPKAVAKHDRQKAAVSRIFFILQTWFGS